VLVDANLLIYAVDKTSRDHERAAAWLQATVTGRRRVGVPWSSLSALLRVTTSPRIYPSPSSPEVAWAVVDALLAHEMVWTPAPTPRHAEVYRDLMIRHGATANLLPDVELAALALQHGLTVCSTDTDFARFTEIRWENPLAA